MHLNSVASNNCSFFLRKNAEKVIPLKDSEVVFEDDGKLTIVHFDVAPGYYPVCKFTVRPYSQAGWKKLRDAYRLVTKQVVDNLDF